jgi:hypothetical protein
MTVDTIKQFKVYNKDNEHTHTITLNKITLEKPYFARVNADTGVILDLRKSQSYVKFDMHSEKLRRVNGYYEVSIYNESRGRADCWMWGDGLYVKEPHKIPITDFKLEDVILKYATHSPVVFLTEYHGNHFGERRAPTPNNNTRWRLENGITRCSITITEDLLGEDVPLPNRAIKQAKTREDKINKAQNRIKLFETFIEPTLENEQSLCYYKYKHTFAMPYAYVEKILKQHVEEVVIPRFKELGIQMDIKDFDLRVLTYHCSVPLTKVKLDSIDIEPTNEKLEQ